MKHLRFSTCLLVLASISIHAANSFAGDADAARAEIDRIWNDAEARFEPPPRARFTEARTALQEETARVGRLLDNEGPEYAAAWKSFLHWELLERNTDAERGPNLDELSVVRRWMYSNREGLEGPVFADLRTRLDAYIDAAFTFAQPDLPNAYAAQVSLARRLARELAGNPNDAAAAELGKTLGWFERTRLAEREVAATRALLARPNLQLRIRSELIERYVGRQDLTHVSETVTVTDQVTAPSSGLRRSSRTLQLQGTATIEGEVKIEPVPNADHAQLDFNFRGNMHSICAADAGPVTLRLLTEGPVAVTKPLFISPEGLRFGDSQVVANVSARVTQVDAPGPLLQRLGERQATRPPAHAHMQSSARERTSNQLREEFDERIQSAIAEAQAEQQESQELIARFEQITAPFKREGAVPRFFGCHSATDAIGFDIEARQPGQFAAPTSPDWEPTDGDVSLGVHVSFVNNTAETMFGGKILSDAFFMNNAKLLHAQLPMELMVHERAPRWGIRTEKTRPLTIQIIGPRVFAFEINLAGFEFDGAMSETTGRATISYELVEDAYGEFFLERRGDVELSVDLPPEQDAFLHEKLSAFFGRTITGRGIVIPESDRLRMLREIQLASLRTAGEWLIIGLNIPDAALDGVDSETH